jgi:hypothetical protein
MKPLLKNVLLKIQTIALGVMLGILPGYVAAYDDVREHPASANLMIVDALVMRPATFGATLLGSVAFVISLPFSATGGNVAEAREKLIMEPWRYTFHRPLGKFP